MAAKNKKQWYVVHTYSGYEQKVKKALEERVRSAKERLPREIAGLEARAKRSPEEERRLESCRRELAAAEKIAEVLLPAEKVVEVVKGKQRTASRKFFPGYILVKMELNDDTWHIVKSIPKVTGFVGGANEPVPVPEEEVQEITEQMKEGASRSRTRVMFETGENVKVIDGPFQDFNGVVEEVKPEKGKLRVLISIFGRATPVELDVVQVEKA